MPRARPKNSALADSAAFSSKDSQGPVHPSRRPPKAAAATLRKLRQTAKSVRKQVAQDREQIASEARSVIASAVAHGKLIKLTVLLRQDEQAVLQAIESYATAHGLKSRNQVLRAALAKLLDIDLAPPHWSWTKGRLRTK